MASAELLSWIEPAGDRLPIGTIVLDKERVVVLIPADIRLPLEYRSRFVYAYDNMTAVRLELTVGLGETREEVHVIGKVELMGLAPRPKGTPIEVVLDHRGNVLIATLIDVESGTTAQRTMMLRE